MMKRHYILLWILSLVFSSIVWAKPITQPTSQFDPTHYDQEIGKLLNKKSLNGGKNIQQRITTISNYFLGKPYSLGPLGEGPTGRFDQDPLYRTDRFDCLTYVNTVLALAHSKNLAEFKKHIKNIRYHKAIVSYINRNHFMTVDWNPNNASNGYIRDITHEIVDDNGKPIAKTAETIINKPAWYRHKDSSAFRKQAYKVHAEKGSLLYIPLNAMFDSKGNPKKNIFDQIPHASIIEIVRPNWQLAKKIGTNLNVSHLGFAIRNSKGLIYREASLTERKVIDVPMTEYLKKYLHSPTVKGINVQEIVNKNLLIK